MTSRSGRPCISTALIIFCVLAAGCGGTGPGQPPDDKGDLRWWYTCGDPVCQGWTAKPGIPACTTQVAGEACTVEGDQCDPMDGCNRLLVCAVEDPTQQPGGCPISRAAFKTDIGYLGDADLVRARDELLGIRLATYRYRATPADGPLRLGFIIDDAVPAEAVLPNGEQVDVYGYASLAVAAVQVQAKEIDALRAEVERLRAEVAALRASNPR